MPVLNKFHYNAPVILTYAVLAFFGTLIVSSVSQVGASLFFIHRAEITLVFVLRLFTHVLGHINMEHFTGNFMLILLIGPILEEKYGSRTILATILITAFVTGFVNVLLFETALMGASGVAFCLIVIASLVNLRQGSIPITFVLIVALYIGREIYSAINYYYTNISHLTHILGGVCGAAIGLFLARKDRRAFN